MVQSEPKSVAEKTILNDVYIFLKKCILLEYNEQYNSDL